MAALFCVWNMMRPLSLADEMLSPYTNGIGWALLVAFQTGDALFRPIVGDPELIAVGCSFHRTYLVAGPTPDAVLCAFRENGCESVEY